MRIATAIKERLEQNSQQLRQITDDSSDSRKQQIQREYLKIEAEAFHTMLDQIQRRRWRIFRDRKFMLVMAILSMSMYVLGMFYMFKELDLARVEQWQFAVTAMPLWLILIIVPMAIITLLTARKSRY